MWKVILILFALTLAIDASPQAASWNATVPSPQEVNFKSWPPIAWLRLTYFGNGCCRFDNWRATYQGYLNIKQCLKACYNDLSCVAADMARPRGDDLLDEYACYTFTGSLENLHTSCGNKKDQHCFARKMPTKCIDDPRCPAALEYYKKEKIGECIGKPFCSIFFEGNVVNGKWWVEDNCRKHCNTC